ncbi:nodulation protein NolW [Methylotenera oryzisoli]|uniref:Nodulation protein NolW n=1 Tax=Methylotenera oryzisoli TaxID=2080758 RepID=A0A4Y9VQH5_9PROT|nr:secretin N-terminal domain-containing protein [Methylotenera oryzisoli]TFW70336.1 nodulation protein NolW [Methylotenera oryzisoli]
MIRLLIKNRWLWLLLALSLTLQSHAANDFKIFTLQHRFAEEVLPTIQAVIGNHGTASAIQNQLIVRTDSKTMAEVEQTIATLDTARENFTISVKRQNNVTGTSRNTTVKGRTRIGNVAIQTENDARSGRDGIQIGLEDNQTSSRQSSQQFIRVTDGAPAYISVGESIPYTSEWVMLTRRYAVRQVSTEFVDIGTGFTVRARSIGSQVELEITPTFSSLQQNGRIEFEQLSSTVRAQRGEWVNLGGMMQDKDEVSRAILASSSGQSSQNNQLFIRVE